MGEYVIFHVTRLDKFTGEQIIALDALGKTNGLLCHSYDVDRGNLLKMTKGTVVENYKLVEMENLKHEIESLPEISKEGRTKITIDHCFDVKSVGTVALGRVDKGIVKTYDNLKLLPQGADVMIKSIQMHDDTVAEAKSPARVGLSVKGVSVDDVQRGDVICSPDSMEVRQEITLDYKPNRYFKEEISQNQTFIVNIGLQLRAGKILSLNPMKLSLVKPAALDKDMICVILKPESQTMRIAGSGKII
ncbi:MAG: elongation factor Tu [Candidatus Aenigmarchaeota archaeon]|nr:elongation factor Tu [Candidatus Aenigmarchaeota archaeon]